MFFDAIYKTHIIVFEAVFVLAIMGIALSIYTHCHKKTKLFYIVLISLLFMFVWRSNIELLSERYCSIFIFAGVGFSAYTLMRLPLFLGFKIPKLGFLKKYYRLIGRSLCLILVAVGIGKIFRYNRYDDYIYQSSLSVLNDENFDKNFVILDFISDAGRIEYYTNMHVVTIAGERRKILDIKELKEHLKKSPNCYVFCNSIKDNEFSSKDLNLKDKEWKKLISYPRSNRKNRYVNVYRYEREKSKCKEL